MKTAKFALGQRVKCSVVRGEAPWNWEGEVTKIALAGDEFEYAVTGAPKAFDHPQAPALLVWESEVEAVNKGT